MGCLDRSALFLHKLHQILSLPSQATSESDYAWLGWECLQVLNGGHFGLDGSSLVLPDVLELYEVSKSE